VALEGLQARLELVRGSDGQGVGERSERRGEGKRREGHRGDRRPKGRRRRPALRRHPASPTAAM
jgi:hypothetical protein